MTPNRFCSPLCGYRQRNFLFIVSAVCCLAGTFRIEAADVDVDNYFFATKSKSRVSSLPDTNGQRVSLDEPRAPTLIKRSHEKQTLPLNHPARRKFDTKPMEFTKTGAGASRVSIGAGRVPTQQQLQQ
jgi:hypothetical protein